MVKGAIEALERGAPAAAIVPHVAAIVVLAGANALARLGSRFTIVGAAQRVEYDLRNDLFASLLAAPPAFYARHSTGDLMARAGSDVNAVRMLLGFGAASFAGTTFAFVGTLGAMAAVDPWLTACAMAPYPVLVLLAKRYTTAVHHRAEAAQAQLAALSTTVQEHLAGISVVRAYTMEARAAEAFDAGSRAYLGGSLELARLQAQFMPLMGLIGGVGTLIVLWVGGAAVLAGGLSLGALVAFNGYLAYLTWPTIALGWTLSIVRRGLTSMARLGEIMGPGPQPLDAAPAMEGPPALRFSHLSFAYEGRAPALEDVSFEVGAGETVAVVGHTGSGKSTLGLLLARLWEPPSGTIFVDGRDVTTLSPVALRVGLGYVPQEAFLFSRSIADNITLGREGVADARARAAAGAAGIAPEIEAFPRGWQTVVGERGLTVSGGQRQRLALARALAGDPRLLVLDDVYASVDAAKEEEIVDNLRRVAAGRTVLLMTHRLRAARAAHRIVVLSRGRVVETGTHAELLEARGVYADLWRIEQLEEEIARA